MDTVTVNDQLSISGQLAEEDVQRLAGAGVTLFICNRPDSEAAEQPPFSSLQSVAEKCSARMLHLPFKTGAMTQDHIDEFGKLLKTGERIHAFCRTGNRSFCLFAAAHAQAGKPKGELLGYSQRVGIDIKDIIKTYYGEAASPMTKQNQNSESGTQAKSAYDVVIVGAGSGGIAVASSLRNRNSELRIALIDPAEEHSTSLAGPW